MAIILQEPHQSWLKNHVGPDCNESTKYKIKIGGTAQDNSADVEIDIDLIWFILLYVEDNPAVKLEVVLELLKNPVLLQNFKNTLSIPAAKRVIAEFLLFNFPILDSLKLYIDFNLLDVPLDIISHALFIKRGSGIEDNLIMADRLRCVNAILASGYKFPAAAPKSSQGAVLAKVLLMEDLQTRFTIARKLIDAGYVLFNSSADGNGYVAIALIDNRNDPEVAQIIKQNLPQFKNIKVRVADAENSNLADYYYWVKEDMDALRYVKEMFGIELTPST